MQVPEESEDKKNKQNSVNTDEPQRAEFEDEEEAYSFMKESIKDEQPKEKIRKNVPKIAAGGLIFGVCAAVTFSVITPIMENLFFNQTKEVSISDSEQDPDSAEASSGTDTEQTDKDADKKESEKSESTKSESSKDETTEKVTFSTKDYRKLQQSLNKTAKAVMKSVVTITGVKEDEDETETFYNENTTSGLIVADNGRQLLILAKTSVAKKADKIYAAFSDDRQYKAKVKKSYSVLGYSIYSVEKSVIKDKSWNSIEVAELGTFYSVSQGDTMIAVGSPFGYAGSLGYGVASSVKNSVLRTDGEYPVILTDIPGNTESSGILADLNGKIVGMIDGSITEESGSNQVMAYGITELKEIIEMLSNGIKVPYVGINGYTVTDKMEKKDIPAGVFVTEVDIDSPAMDAGIQSGDIITSVAGTEVTSLADYQELLQKQAADEEIQIIGKRKSKNDYTDIEFTLIPEKNAN